MSNRQKVYKSKLIIQNKEFFINKCNQAYDILSKTLKTKDTTFTYSQYNLFAVTAADENFYQLYTELKNIIRKTYKKDEPLWMQTWLNYHAVDSVLDWHDHGWLLHGYISIDPKDTSTIFDNGFEVNNKVGNIYIGPCKIKHKVVVHKPYEGYRITIGFDVCNHYFKNSLKGFSFIPI